MDSGFVPMRLILQPSGLVLEVNRPEMTMGRHSEADLRLPLYDVSRRHCLFAWENGVWRVSDLSSLNGIFINGMPVRHSNLMHGDRLRVGSYTFAVDMLAAQPSGEDNRPTIDPPASGVILRIQPVAPRRLAS